MYELNNSNSSNFCCCSTSLNVVSTKSKEEEIQDRRESRFLIDIDRYYNKHHYLPEYFNDIFDYLNRDVKIVGLLRIPGQCNTVSKIIRMLLFEKKKLKDIEFKYNSYDICGVMKGVLNKLSEPLIPYQYFNEIISIKADSRNEMKSVEDIINLWNRILDNLNNSKIELLKLLFNFFNNVNKESVINHMGSENISVILTMGGNIIRSENSLNDIKYFENIVLFFKIFLDNFDEFNIMSDNKLPSIPSNSSLLSSSLCRTRSSNTKLNLTRSRKMNNSVSSLRVYDILDDKMKKVLKDNKLNENESVILRSGNLNIDDILPPSNYHLVKSEDNSDMKLESVINEDLSEEMKSGNTTARDRAESKESNINL